MNKDFDLAEIVIEASKLNIRIKFDMPRRASLMLNNPTVEDFNYFQKNIIALRNKCNNDQIEIVVYVTNIYTQIFEDDYGKSILKKIEYYTHFVTN